MSAFTTVTVKISKTKTKTKRLAAFNLSVAEAEVKFRNIRSAYGRNMKRVKKYSLSETQSSLMTFDESVEVLVSSRIFCEPKNRCFRGFEADDDVD